MGWYAARGTPADQRPENEIEKTLTATDLWDPQFKTQISRWSLERSPSKIKSSHGSQNQSSHECSPHDDECGVFEHDFLRLDYRLL